MKILTICSKAFYKDIPPIKEKLEAKGHEIFLPNSYGHEQAEQEAWNLGEKEHAEFKARMFKRSKDVTLNFDKNGKKNYIGGATFLELYEAFMADKKIYLYNDIPEGMLYDEISGFSPVILHGNLDLI